MYLCTCTCYFKASILRVELLCAACISFYPSFSVHLAESFNVSLHCLLCSKAKLEISNSSSSHFVVLLRWQPVACEILRAETDHAISQNRLNLEPVIIFHHMAWFALKLHISSHSIYCRNGGIHPAGITRRKILYLRFQATTN